MMDKNLNLIISCRISQNSYTYYEPPRSSYVAFLQTLCLHNLLESHFIVLLFCEPYFENSFVIEESTRKSKIPRTNV